MFQSIYRDEYGGIALPLAIALPLVMLLIGVSLDMRRVTTFKQELQTIADNGALYAARELAISSNDTARVEAVAVSYASTTVARDGASIFAEADTQKQMVKLSISASPDVYFMNPFEMIKSVQVEAEAQLTGSSGNLCLIALTETNSSAIEINNKAKLTAEDCAIYSNSLSAQSLRVNPTASISVDQVFLAGGYQGNVKNLSSAPVTDAPKISDPLAGRQPPSSVGCDYNDYTVNESQQEASLQPGIYCGGLTVDNALVIVNPGEYIIKNGPLEVVNGGSLLGADAGFYLTGTDAKIHFAADSNIDLSAPRSGRLAGLLFFSNVNNPEAKTSGNGKKLKGGHIIRSDNARRLVGTIYLPDDKLVVDGETPVADQSEYTVIVAKAFELNNGPNLVLQTDYASSNVPVPDGVGADVSGESFARLVQ